MTLVSPQDAHQPDVQQHGHPGGAEEEGLSPKPGETPFQEQHHAATELAAPANARHERIAAEGPSDDARCYERETCTHVYNFKMSDSCIHHPVLFFYRLHFIY